MQSQNQDNDNGRSAPFVRRATQQTSLSELWSQNISIHALREEGDMDKGKSWANRMISIHASARRATPGRYQTVKDVVFLSTPSARWATKMAKIYKPYGDISIHALREEGDLMGSPLNFSTASFYPRPPRGGRP